MNEVCTKKNMYGVPFKSLFWAGPSVYSYYNCIAQALSFFSLFSGKGHKCINLDLKRLLFSIKTFIFPRGKNKLFSSRHANPTFLL